MQEKRRRWSVGVHEEGEEGRGGGKGTSSHMETRENCQDERSSSFIRVCIRHWLDIARSSVHTSRARALSTLPRGKKKRNS